MEKPTLSIITICRNIRDDILDTCKSVSAQKWRDFEWIVIDGGSNDGTVEAIEPFKNDISYFVSEKDNGIFHAMNKGIAVARGERVIFMNGGDSFASDDVLERVFAGKRHSADVIYGDVFFSESSRIVDRMVMNPNGALVDKFFFTADNIHHQGAFIKRELFDRFGMYNEENRIVSDWEKWIEFAGGGCTFEKVDVVVAIFNLHGVSSSPETKRTNTIEAERVIRKHFTPEECVTMHERREGMGRYGPKRSLTRIPGLVTMKESPDRTRSKYYVAGLPVLKITRRHHSRPHVRLLGLFSLSEMPRWLIHRIPG